MREGQPRNHRLRAIKHAAMLLALAAIALRALIPAGWMPGSDHTGHGAPLVICTASGVQTVYSESDRRAPVPAKPAHHDICPFAGVGALAAGATALALIAPPVYADVPTPAVREPVLRFSRLPGAAGPRAPPAFPLA